MATYEIGITEINTQVRRLGYVSSILAILSDKTLSESLLYERLERWSVEHESELKSYVNPQGQIKPTRMRTSAKRYTEFAISLGLVGRIAGACRITRFGRPLLPFISKASKANYFELILAERYLYLYWLFIKDSDRLMTVLNMLGETPTQNLSLLQKKFKDSYVKQLDNRLSQEESQIGREILALRNRVIHEWKNPERYAESIVPPRINWLLDIGLVRIEGLRKSVNLTEEGQKLLDLVREASISGQSHVNQQWIQRNFFGCIGSILANQDGYLWCKLSQKEKTEYLNDVTASAFSLLRSSPAPKISLYPALIYMCLFLAVEKQIWANLYELRDELSNLSSMPNPIYEVRFSHRENESYLISHRTSS
ncbi:hypothetical protein [Pseudanabaena sp. 'Roaring Creek']|uniref:hypothetical protein n=1 Tax=Pseudanabaena sp. 'Roaring Creek' TaxID=1681830 RepID=UPI0006D7B007|nr:hypothetical protein [Pseudanabaena sp. 'Roaring Creek']